MIPEVSKLNWSYDKPTFDEVVGKTIWMKFSKRSYNAIIDNRKDYDRWMACVGFIAYAILDDTLPEKPEEPMGLWGVMPEVNHGDIEGAFFWIKWGHKNNENWFIETPCYPTRSEAVRAWNKIAKALQEVEL